MSLQCKNCCRMMGGLDGPDYSSPGRCGDCERARAEGAAEERDALFRFVRQASADYDKQAERYRDSNVEMAACMASCASATALIIPEYKAFHIRAHGETPKEGT